MQPPSSLNTRGQDAYISAVETLQAIGEDADLYGETIIRYARACDDEETARQAWAMDGNPMHAVGSTGALVAHPLSKAHRDAMAHAAKLADSLGLIAGGSRARWVASPAVRRAPRQAPDRKLRRAA